MSRLRYYHILGNKGKVYNVRLEMVATARAAGVSAAARAYGTTGKTVRKWVKRYEAEGGGGLADRSRRPKRSPGRTKRNLEKLVVRLREEYPTWGGRRLVERYGLGCSAVTVYNILKREGVYKARRRRWRERRDLREAKKRYGFLGKVQLDVKYLKDIARFYRALKAYELPRYEFTARDVRTGMVVVAFGYEASISNAVTFAHYLGGHIRRWGGKLKGARWQTDNGAEFVGGSKMTRPSAFAIAVESYGVRHERTPPRCPTFNSDVEAFHRTVQDEFYACERIHGLGDFLQKAYTYVAYYNLERPNRYRGGQSPYQIAASLVADPPPQLFKPVPIILDLVDPITGRYHVPCPANGGAVRV